MLIYWHASVVGYWQQLSGRILTAVVLFMLHFFDAGHKQVNLCPSGWCDALTAQTILTQVLAVEVDDEVQRLQQGIQWLLPACSSGICHQVLLDALWQHNLSVAVLDGQLVPPVVGLQHVSKAGRVQDATSMHCAGYECFSEGPAAQQTTHNIRPVTHALYPSSR